MTSTRRLAPEPFNLQNESEHKLFVRKRAKLQSLRGGEMTNGLRFIRVLSNSFWHQPLRAPSYDDKVSSFAERTFYTIII